MYRASTRGNQSDVGPQLNRSVLFLVCLFVFVCHKGETTEGHEVAPASATCTRA